MEVTKRYGNYVMEINCIKRKLYCLEDFTKPLAFFV